MSHKIHACGYKAYILLNRQCQIIKAELLPINTSDQNYLKNHAVHQRELKGFLLADRGFNNKAVRNRLSSNKNNLWNYDKAYCKLISPYTKKSKSRLTEKKKNSI